MAKLDNPVAITNLQDLTQEHLQYFKKNPDKLELISDREDFSIGKYVVILMAAIVLVGTSRYLTQVYNDEISQFINGVVVDLIFEMGAALIGGVATVMFIELQNKRQFERNLRLRLEIERRVAQMNGAEVT